MSPEKIRVLALFGTRPELIKLYPVLDLMRGDDRFVLTVVSTSQHREMIDPLLRLFSIRPDHDLNIIRPNQSLADVSVRVLEGLEPILRACRPDVMLVQGDTSSAFVGALASFYNQVPVGHIEAGLRSFDTRHPFPEEINRRLISVIGDLHFAPTRSNERNLLREGVDPSRVFVTGNTVIDALRAVGGRGTGELDRYLPPDALAGRRMLLVTAHRRESHEAHLAELCHGLLQLVEAYPDLVVVYPVHLNPAVQRTVMALLGGQERIRLIDPLPYEAFVEAMSRSTLIVTDSGGVQEEAPSLGKPVLVFRKVTERGEGLAAEQVRMVGLDRSALVAEASRLLDDPEAYRRMTEVTDLYGDGEASRRIVEAIVHFVRGGPRPDGFVGPASDPPERREKARTHHAPPK